MLKLEASSAKLSASLELAIVSWDRDISPVGWYIATYILRFVELNENWNGDPDERHLTWENTILVEAANMDEAYDKTLMFAARQTNPYKGGREAVDVQWLFEGVSKLLPIYEKLEDGSELFWAPHTRKLKNIRARIRTKADFPSKRDD